MDGNKGCSDLRWAHDDCSSMLALGFVPKPVAQQDAVAVQQVPDAALNATTVADQTVSTNPVWRSTPQEMKLVPTAHSQTAEQKRVVALPALGAAMQVSGQSTAGHPDSAAREAHERLVNIWLCLYKARSCFNRLGQTAISNRLETYHQSYRTTDVLESAIQARANEHLTAFALSIHHLSVNNAREVTRCCGCAFAMEALSLMLRDNPARYQEAATELIELGAKYAAATAAA
ncbi:hypothetical protein LTR56_004368 [Elasticomyces elasticus]|nr:hypothetical protein LTR22_012096 [Elasticomyces elasticus]KAK3653956.1 hypothetical protein LTR56_004368 [Elasticomyces elasticus]KAK4917157.1 hypothetical protein LTR49_014922 [Elasticomyces elasticus]KAK5757114.1 hypothetical protein LTS12_012788 [Elasticomyces elasticus]